MLVFHLEAILSNFTAVIISGHTVMNTQLDTASGIKSLCSTTNDNNKHYKYTVAVAEDGCTVGNLPLQILKIVNYVCTYQL